MAVIGSSAAGKVFKFNNAFEHHGNSKFQSLEVKVRELIHSYSEVLNFISSLAEFECAALFNFSGVGK